MNFELPEDKKEFMRVILEKALSDAEYRERLKENTTDAIQEVHPDYESGSNEIVIVDQTQLSKTYLNVSPLQYALYGGDLDSIELSPEQLEEVAGGCWCIIASCNSDSGNGSGNGNGTGNGNGSGNTIKDNNIA